MGSNESVISAGWRSDGWFLFAVLAVLLALYAQTVLSFYDVFSQEGSGQSHAPLLLLVSLYLIYRAWSNTGRTLTLSFYTPGILALLALSLLWLVLGLVFVEAGQQAVFLMIVATMVVSMLGLRDARKYLVPILLLLTVVPIWSPFTPYFQIASAQTSAYLLDLVGVTSTRDGYLLIIPNGTFEVADACSGMKFQIVAITLALIHTQLIKAPVRIMLVYVALASLLAFFSNVMRIVIVVLIGYNYGMTHEYVQDHNFIGWTVFSLIFFLFLFFGEKKLREYETPMRAEAAEGAQALTPGRRWVGTALVVSAICIGPLLHGYLSGRDPVAHRDEIAGLQQLDGWRTSARGLTEWAPIWTRGDRTYEGTLENGQESVDLFATEFVRQSQGHEAVNVSHRVYDIDKWSRISRSVRVVEVPGVGQMMVEETLLKSPGQKKRLVWQWYSTHHRIVATTLQAKLNNLIGVILGEPDISVFVLSKEILRNETHAAEVLEQFFRDYVALSGDLS